MICEAMLNQQVKRERPVWLQCAEARGNDLDDELKWVDRFEGRILGRSPVHHLTVHPFIPFTRFYTSQVQDFFQQYHSEEKTWYNGSWPFLEAALLHEWCGTFRTDLHVLHHLLYKPFYALLFLFAGKAYKRCDLGFLLHKNSDGGVVYIYIYL